MKDYNEVAKSVFERSKELIIKKNKRNMRIMTAVRTSGICLVLVSVIGFGSWLGGSQGGDIASTVDGSFPSASDNSTAVSNNSEAASEGNSSSVKESEAASEENSSSVKETVFAESEPPSAAPAFHAHDYINSENTVKDNFDTPPKNGKVYISSQLKNALDTVGDCYEDGCKAPYLLLFDYYKDGQLIVPTEALHSSEWERLKSHFNCYEGSEEYTQTCTMGFGSYRAGWDAETEYFIHGNLYKPQIESFPPNEDYAVVISLDDGHSATFWEGESTEIDKQPEQEMVRTPFSIYSHKSGPYTLETPPENGKVKIAESLLEAIEYNGQYYEGNAENLFVVVIEYYKDGQRIDPDEAFYEKEKIRLKELCGTNRLEYSPASEEPECRDFNFMYVELTRSQMDKITVDDSTGCTIYLIGDYQHTY